METKHTSGPWYIEGLNAGGEVVVRAEDYEIATCWHHCVGSIEKEMHANARLIAAAPVLLGALRDIEARTYRKPTDGGGLSKRLIDIRQYAMEAIAKATGES
jgi:hypothetical protein